MTAFKKVYVNESSVHVQVETRVLPLYKAYFRPRMAIRSGLVVVYVTVFLEYCIPGEAVALSGVMGYSTETNPVVLG